MPTLFEFLGSINSGDRVDLTGDNPFKDYAPFQINNGLSQHLDTILLANEMNKRPWLSKEMQYKFFQGSVSKKKRYGKWGKADSAEDKETIDLISEYYEVNNSVAAVYLKILTADQLNQLRKSIYKGGSDTVRASKAKTKK